MKNVIPVLLVIMILITGCSPSMRITGSWIDKEKLGKGNFNKTFLMVLTSDRGAQQTIENAQANAATAEGLTTIKSHEAFGPNFLARNPTPEEISNRIRELGCDLIFTSALVDVKSTTRYVPGSMHQVGGFRGGRMHGGMHMGMHGGMGMGMGMGGFGGYMGSAAFIYQPGYYATDHTYFIESNLYDAFSGEILWSVQSKAYNPTKIDRVARTYSALLFERLRKEGITLRK